MVFWKIICVTSGVATVGLWFLGKRLVKDSKEIVMNEDKSFVGFLGCMVIGPWFFMEEALSWMSILLSGGLCI